MERIVKEIDPENDLTIFTCIENITANDISTAICDFYEGPVTSNVLWNLSDSDISEIESADIESIVGLSIDHAQKRSHGKTAIVASADFSFGLSRMYDSIKDAAGLPFETRTFRSLDDACEWLGSD